MSDDETYYDTLGVEPDASRDELKSAYQDRVAELEAAREGKNVSEAALQSNRAEVARVRAAWNVLADPFQRSRYDEQLDTPNGVGEDDDDAGVEIVDDDRPQVQLTGWHKFMAPPPPKPTAKAGAAGNFSCREFIKHGRSLLAPRWGCTQIDRQLRYMRRCSPSWARF